MKTIGKKLIVMLLAVMMTMACAVPAFAASYPNKVGGYSVPATLTMQLGESKVLTVTSPSNGKYINVSFQTSNNIVKMSGYSAGSYWGKKAQIKFTGNKTGSFYSIATVEVFNKKGVPSSQIAEYKLYCKVTVTPKTVNVSRIKLNRSSLTLTEGESVKLTATISPSNATDKTVTWSSSNPSVVTVSNGTITAKKPGTAIITTRSSNGKKASCRVTVKKKIIPVTSVSLSQYSVSLTVGSTTTIYATVKPANATNKTVTWSSSNPSVATVSGGRITAKKPGTAKITAKSNNGKKATCTVKVTADNGKYLNVSDAYTILNTFRTTKSNQWYWNASNTKKVTTYGLKALKRDAALEKVAKLRAKEQWTQYYVNGKQTHDRPNGSSCFTAYPTKTLKAWGENLAWGQTSSREVILDGTWGWAETNCKYSGQGHRRNMLNSRYTKVGIACYTKNGKTCWAMSLGA